MKKEKIKYNDVGACIARPQNKTQRGITLIALVITIIVLLILAGVTINLTIGERGIFRTAQQGAKNYIDSAKQEENMLAKLTNTTDKIIANVTGGNGGTPPSTPTIDESILALKAGDYIKYDSGTNGVITCRVLYPANSEYGLQIISDKNVKNVTLGSENYTEAVTSYNNAIETLNNEAENYINTEYAYDGRCVGSAPTVEKGMFVNKDKVKFEGTEEYITPSDANYYKPPFENTNYINSYVGDISYGTDYGTMITATSQGTGIDVTGEEYWLASRHTLGVSTACNFNGRIVDTSGKLSGYSLCIVTFSGDTFCFAHEKGLRPCISLKSDIIKITGGDGKSADTAYLIGK